jgi:hypothetical protein
VCPTPAPACGSPPPPPPGTAAAYAVAITAATPWWRDFGEPRALSGPPEPTEAYADGMTHLRCTGDSRNSRACWLSNICFDPNGPNHPLHKLTMYAPAASAGPDGRLCAKVSGGDNRTVCHGDNDWILHSTVQSGFVLYTATFARGPIDERRVARWVEPRDTPTLAFGRFYPWNIAHVLADDAFGVFHALRTRLGWTPESAYAWRASGRAPLRKYPPGPPPPGQPPMRHFILYMNDWRAIDDPEWIYTIFTDVFPNVQFFHPQHTGEPAPTAERPLVCWRRMAMGMQGWSMFRNGAYSNHIARLWGRHDGDFDAARYLASHLDYSDHLARTYGQRSRAEAVAAAGDRPGLVVVIQRDDGPGKPRKRYITNIGDLLMDLRIAFSVDRAGPRSRRIVVHQFGNMTADIALMQAADLVIAVHGAGSMNVWFMRPGSAWIDLLPPRSVAYQPTMLAVAHRFGVRFFTQPLIEGNCTTDEPHDAPEYRVHPGAVTGLASLVMGLEP